MLLTDKEIKKWSTSKIIHSIIAYNNLPKKKHDTGKPIIVARLLYAELLKRKFTMNYGDYELLFDGLVKDGIRSSLVLHMYINMFLGFDIPRTQCCKGHIAPFTFVKEMFFEQCSNAIAFANRTGGKTLNISIINHLHMTFKPGCRVCTAGCTQEQASNGYDYLREFHYGDGGDVNDAACKVLTDKLISPRKEPTMTRTVYTNNSRIKIITGTEKGANSPHLQKVCLDEIDLLDRWKIVQQFMSISESKRGIAAANIFSSTRKGDQGPFQRLLTYSEKQIKDYPKMPGQPALWKQYRWCIWETLEKCTRGCKGDLTYGDCPAYRMCKGRAQRVPGGWYKLSDFVSKAGSMDEETFRVEWLNQRPKGSVRVYGDSWDRVKHFIDPIKQLTGDIYYIGGMDFGTGPGHDTVFQLYTIDCTEFKREVEEAEGRNTIIYSKPRYYLTYEYRAVGRIPMATHAKKIRGCPNYSDGLIIFADPSGAQSRVELFELGIDTYDAIRDVESGIATVRGYLEPGYDGKPNYYIFNDYLDCSDLSLVGTDMEFELYKYKMTDDGKPNPKKPLEIYDHGMDVTRYVLQSALPYFRELFTPVYDGVEQEGFLFKALDAKMNS